MTSTARYDGLINCVTGLGDDELDVRRHTRREWQGQFTTADLEQEWLQNWMAEREVSQLPRDMFRRGFELEQVQPPEFDVSGLKSWIEGDQEIGAFGGIDRKHGILWYARELREQGDKLGGAALMPILADGLDPIRPLDVRRIQRVVDWIVFDRSEIFPYWTTNTLKPEYYVLTGTYQSAHDLQPGDVIHASRLFVHVGRRLSAREMRYRNGWGASTLELNWHQRRGVEEGQSYMRTYADRCSWLEYRMANLSEVLGATDPETGAKIGETVVADRMRTVRVAARTMSIVPTDGGSQGITTREGTISGGRNPDEVRSVTESTGDLTKIVEADLNHWQYGSKIPASIAFGQTLGGLRGGDNAGDWQSWQGTVGAEQTTSETGTELVNWMLAIVMSAREGPTRGRLPKSWTIKWRPLLLPTEQEQAEINDLRAVTDNRRIDSGTVSPDEVRQQRFVDGDVEGQLRVVKRDKSVLEPSLIGLATMALDGGIAVAEGRMTPEYLAGLLHKSDERRWPVEDAMAQAVRAVRPGAAPDTQPSSGATPTAPVPTEAAADADDGPTEPSEAEQMAALLSSDPRPSDAMPAKQAAAVLADEHNIQISSQRILSMARQGKIRHWDDDGRVVISLADVMRRIAVANGLLDEPAAEYADTVVSRGGKWLVLSKAGDKFGEFGTRGEAEARLAEIERIKHAKE